MPSIAQSQGECSLASFSGLPQTRKDLSANVVSWRLVAARLTGGQRSFRRSGRCECDPIFEPVLSGFLR